MNTPILTLVDDLIHTFAHPYCGNTTCTCNTPLRDAHTEAVAQVRSIERAMSLQEAREILRITARRLGDSYTATYDSETESLQLICAGSDIRLILTLEACYQLSDFLNAMLPMHKNLDSYLQWRLNAMLALCQNHTSKGQAESEAH